MSLATKELEKRRLKLERIKSKSEEDAITLLSLLAPAQHDLVFDTSRSKVVLTPRQCGKSYAFAIYLLSVALMNPGCNLLYVSITGENARTILWADIVKFNDQYKLGLVFNATHLQITLPNKSAIYLRGANDESAQEKIRGNRYTMAIVDEAGSFERPGLLENLLQVVIGPALDNQRGTLVVGGTPGKDCFGLWYKMTRPIYDKNVSNNWSCHTWGASELEHVFPNIHISREETRIRNEWSLDNPKWLREYCGQWVREDSDLLYNFKQDKNTYRDLPDYNWSHIMGVDLGTNDPLAIVVWAFSYDCRDAYEVFASKTMNLHAAEMAEKVKEVQRKFNVDITVCDAGALGKAIINMWNDRLDMNVMAAEKANKWETIGLMNSDFHEKHIWIREDSPLIDELESVRYDKETKQEVKSIPNDLTDAALYGWRYLQHYLYEPSQEAPKLGTPEWFAEEEEKMYKRAEKEARHTSSNICETFGLQYESLFYDYKDR